MKNNRYSIKFDKKTGFFNVFLSGFVPMYCNSYKSKEDARLAIKQNRKK